MNILMLHSSSDLYGASRIFSNTIGALKQNITQPYACKKMSLSSIKGKKEIYLSK